MILTKPQLTLSCSFLCCLLFSLLCDFILQLRMGKNLSRKSAKCINRNDADILESCFFFFFFFFLVLCEKNFVVFMARYIIRLTFLEVKV